MGYAITFVFGIVTPVYRQKTLTIVWSLAIFTTTLIGVRGAEFTLYFPEKVGKFWTRAYTFHQWRILCVDGLPVNTWHVFCPEVLALQAPGLSKHLLPFCSGLYRYFYATQVHPTCFAVCPISVVSFRRLVSGFQYTQSLAGSVDQRFSITW